jgi:CzcA family heavy metal efflux pump
MGPVASIMGEILLVGVYADGTGPVTEPMELRSLVDWTLRPRLLAIPGVAQAIAIGGGVKQYQVQVSPKQLAALGVTLEEVERAAGLSQGNTTGGFVDRKSQEYLVRNLARTASVDELRDTVVATRNGVPITLGQVGEVVLAPRTLRGNAGVGVKAATGAVSVRPAVILSIQKQPGADTVALTAEIERVLGEAATTSLPAGVKTKVLFRQANFIKASVTNVAEALRDGTIIVVVVLFLFLLNFRTTFITLTAIPLSFVVTAGVMELMGLSVNTMTLGGLAVAIGELVDDAIVDVENVFRRLKENRHRPEAERASALAVIARASMEVRGSIVFATAVVILVFVPLFAMSGIEGRLFMPLGVAYIVAILASMVVSLTVTPVLAYFLLPRAKVMGHERDSFLVRFLKARQRSVLGWTLKHPYQVMAGAAVLVVAAAVAVPFMGREFLPTFNEGTVTINLLAVPGTSLSESDRIGALAEHQILEVPEAVSTGRRTGRAELDEHAEGVHYTEIDVDLRRSERTRAQILDDLRHRLDRLPGVVVNLGQPISHRLDHLLSGVRAQIAVKIFGDDLAGLRGKAQEAYAAMAKVPGVVDLQIEKQVLIPQLAIRVKRDQARNYGLAPGELAEHLEGALAGKVVGQVLDGQRTYDIVVRFDDATRADPKSVGDALIDTPAGKVPLRVLADVDEDAGPNQIVRENAQRRIVVSANVSGRDLGTVVRELQAAVRDHVDLAGYFVQFGGQFQSQEEATRLIGLLSIFSFFAIFIVLYTHFKDWRLVLQILINIPLALIGSVVAILITDRTFSVATLIGFITLCGIASRNTIMMISHYLHLVKEEGERFDEEMVIRGSLERLVPVLMTALTAGLALVPLVLAKGEAGKEILYPVAAVILGGLTSSTLLDLFVTPTVFFKFGRRGLDKVLAADRDHVSQSPTAVSEVSHALPVSSRT